MFEVSTILMREVSYEENVPKIEELNLLKTGDMHVYETY